MFNLFKKKSEKEKLQQQYEKLMKQAHALSTTNRAQSDAKVAEAQEVLDALDALKE